MKPQKIFSKNIVVFCYLSFCFLLIVPFNFLGCAGTGSTLSKNQIESSGSKDSIGQNKANTEIVEETFESNQIKTNQNKINNTNQKNDSLQTDKSQKTGKFFGVPSESTKTDETLDDAKAKNTDGAELVKKATGVQIVEKPPFYPTQKLGDIFFEYDAFILNKKYKEVLKVNAEWLSQNPEIKIKINGHCDERGTNNYNLGLGEKRASSVKKFLIAKGISNSRIYTSSFGEEKPFCFERTEECWEQNRRAHFQISKKT